MSPAASTALATARATIDHVQQNALLDIFEQIKDLELSLNDYRKNFPTDPVVNVLAPLECKLYDSYQQGRGVLKNRPGF